MTPPRRLALVAASALAGGAVVAAPFPAAAAPALAIPLPSVLPSWAPAAQVLGATPASQQVIVDLALAGKDPAGEKAYGAAVTTPGNPLYRQWLTKDQFQQRFGAQPGAATAVTTALKGLGVTNVMTDRMGLSVLAVMPASVAAKTFAVTFRQLDHLGVSTRVAMNQPTLPAILRSQVSGISGLTQDAVHTDHTALEPVSPALSITDPEPTAYFNAGPTSTYYGSKLAKNKPTYPVLAGDTSTTKPYVTSGYTPAQLRGAYGVNQVTQTGKGVKVGIALFYDGPKVASDLATFSKAFRLAVPDYTDLTAFNEGIDYAAGGAPVLMPLEAASEQTLDAEAIHQMAPGAAIDYSGAVAPEDPAIYVALDTLLANGVDVINNSYGGVGDTDAADAAVFQTLVTGPAETMGVGLDFSSGDSGDDVMADGVREVDFPASSDEVTAVGGTLLEVGKKNTYGGEAYWGTYTSPALGTGKTWGALASQPGGAGGGGGVSTNYAEPSWQDGVVPAEETQNTDTGTTMAGRVVPDVSMLADSTTGILVGETQLSDNPFPGGTSAYSYFRIGGTSVSSPLFTGMMALVDQALGTSAGFVNPTIYPFSASHPTAFRDPHIGRTTTGSRAGSTAAQLMSGTCVGASGDADYSCTGTGPGVVPVTAEVRADYTDTANKGMVTGTFTDPTGLLPIQTGTTPGNPVIFHLRGQGVLGTLEDLPGYDDSTGLGSPYAPTFLAAFTASGTGTTTSPTSGASTAAAAGPSSTSPLTKAVRPLTSVLGGIRTFAFTGSGPILPIVAAVLAWAAVGGLRMRRRLHRPAAARLM